MADDANSAGAWPCASPVPETSSSAEGGTVAALPCQTGDADVAISACAWSVGTRDVGGTSDGSDMDSCNVMCCAMVGRTD